jgi:hypothetical protein
MTSHQKPRLNNNTSTQPGWSYNYQLYQQAKNKVFDDLIETLINTSIPINKEDEEMTPDILETLESLRN